MTANPIKTADNNVKIYACKKATNISIKNINKTNNTDIGATDQPAITFSPLFDDPFFRRFFGGQLPRNSQSRKKVQNSLLSPWDQ